jgi:hypothetical protein
MDTTLEEIVRKKEVAEKKRDEIKAKYVDTIQRTNAAHEAMEEAWQDRLLTKEQMLIEFRALEALEEENKELWDAYEKIREYASPRIEQLRDESNVEHEEMKKCFDQASLEYERGNKKLCSSLSKEGREHQRKRNLLNDEVSTLCQQIKQAKEAAEKATPKSLGDAYRQAKALFEEAKKRHEAARANFKVQKVERDLYRTEYEAAKEECDSLEAAFLKRLEELKFANKRPRGIVGKVDIGLIKSKPYYVGTVFGENAKIVEKKDGSGVDVYFNGTSPNGDGLGHGHAVIDNNGNVTYLRDAWSKHGEALIKNKPS